MRARQMLLVCVASFAALTGCAAKKPRKVSMFEFHGIHRDGTCVVDNKLSHWNAKGAFVVICKP